MKAWFESRGADAHTATHQAYGAVYAYVQQHAAMLAFVEAFWVMAIMFLAMIPFVFIMRSVRAPAAALRPPAPAGTAKVPELPPKKRPSHAEDRRPVAAPVKTA